MTESSINDRETARNAALLTERSKKYDELVGAVLALELASDPISDANLSLQ
jgi:hypothetical protein